MNTPSRLTKERIEGPAPMKKEELWNGLSHVAANPAAPDDDFKC
jgi:hypothetical protein